MVEKRGTGLHQGDEIILHVPVRGYLRYIPAIYQGEGPVESREVLRKPEEESGVPDDDTSS